MPWNKNSNKFMCPCHGSQYDKNGMVVRGPAPLSLALAKLSDQDGLAVFTSWYAQTLQGYLAHKKQPPPLGSPQDPRHRPTVESCVFL